MIIYKVTNLINQKVYIGQTINSLGHRGSQHYKDCNRKNYYNNRFHNALNKYRLHDFKMEVRTLTKLYNLNGRKELVKHLIEISKNIC